jgi:putative Mn2+ efflux pump MntP
MNTTLLLEQLTVAIVVSAVVVPTVQRVKGWFPSARWVEAFSALIAVMLGFIMSKYYAGYDTSASAWVGFYSLIGAETIYRLVAEKLTTYKKLHENDELGLVTGIVAEEILEENNEVDEGKVG